MFRRFGLGCTFPLGVDDDLFAGESGGGAAVAPVGTQGASDAPISPAPADNHLVQVFPVYYPGNYATDAAIFALARNEDDENLKQIWFGNSFANDRGGPNHDAIDIMTPIGLPVFFTSRQTVVNRWHYAGGPRSGVSSNPRGGNSVRAIDAHGNIHYYAHLRDPSIARNGQTYEPGQILGYTGDTGIARGNSHLHYQIRAARPVEARHPYSMSVSIDGSEHLFHTRGGRPINPYEDLVRLALAKRPEAVRRGPHSTQYELPIPAQNSNAMISELAR